jgi:transcriptional regulator with XRE-family HTH domain
MNLKEARRVQGWTAKQLATKLLLLIKGKDSPKTIQGIQSAISFWENGRRNVPLEYQPAICQLLNNEVDFTEKTHKEQNAEVLANQLGISKENALLVLRNSDLRAAITKTAIK